jgi:hypothetical protein
MYSSHMLTFIDYDRDEAMLEPKPYPRELPSLQKYDVLNRQAQSVGLADRCYAVPQTTAFKDRINAAGVKMHASILTGQGALGLNDGSKGTTLVTYLADAWCSGAEM